MKSNDPTIESIEKHIKFLEESIGMGVGNMPLNQKNDSYKSELALLDYKNFIHFADYHYFVSRALFLNYIREYALFSGYQCIENYLKAYIKKQDDIPPKIHSLKELLARCKGFKKESDSFIFSEDISTIFYKFEPYYMVPRYPVTDYRWVSRIIDPDDIYLLDYFVLKFREILLSEGNQSNPLKLDGSFTFMCMEYAPEFYNKFKERNINFMLSNNDN